MHQNCCFCSIYFNICCCWFENIYYIWNSVHNNVHAQILIMPLTLVIAKQWGFKNRKNVGELKHQINPSMMPNPCLMLSSLINGHSEKHEVVLFIDWHRGLMAGGHLIVYFFELLCCCCHCRKILTNLTSNVTTNWTTSDIAPVPNAPLCPMASCITREVDRMVIRTSNGELF